ncbi:MAG: TIGR01459 family HAD-type hydrolase [Rickettsiaceae bacterium]
MLKFRNILSSLDYYDVFLFDLWGVIVEGKRLYPEVVSTINKIIEKDKQVMFISNAPRPNIVSYDQICRWGINIDKPEFVITSGLISRLMIANSKERFNIDNPVVFHIGADRNHDLLSYDLKCTITENVHEANIVVLSIFRDEFEDLEEFDDLLKTIASLNTINLCTNPDYTIPIGNITRHCAGYFAKKIENYGGKVIYTGKPETEIFQYALGYCKYVPLNRVLMIGDTLETDILGASRCSIDSALVLTGNAYKLHKKYDIMSKKLLNIEKVAFDSINTSPTFVTSLN